MTFTPKDWKDYPLTTTPINATALEDLETRVTDYTDSEITALNVSQYATDTDLSTHAADTTSVHGISDTSALVTATEIDAIEVVTQAEYDALTPAATTLYVIVG